MPKRTAETLAPFLGRDLRLDYTAGGLISKPAFGHGYYEARLKMPKGRGWHTSFWMMQNGPKTGLDDRFQEIDVCEQDSRYQHPAVCLACVVGAPDPHLGQRVEAYVELEPDAAPLPTEDELRRFVADRVAGKLDRRGLETQVASDLAST